MITLCSLKLQFSRTILNLSCCIRLELDTSIIKVSDDAIQGQSLYLDGSSGFMIPTPQDPLLMPKVTVGMWIKPTTTDDRIDDPRYDSSPKHYSS